MSLPFQRRSRPLQHWEKFKTYGNYLDAADRASVLAIEGDHRPITDPDFVLPSGDIWLGHFDSEGRCTQSYRHCDCQLETDPDNRRTYTFVPSQNEIRSLMTNLEISQQVINVSYAKYSPSHGTLDLLGLGLDITSEHLEGM